MGIRSRENLRISRLNRKATTSDLVDLDDFDCGDDANELKLSASLNFSTDSDRFKSTEILIRI